METRIPNGRPVKRGDISEQGQREGHRDDEQGKVKYPFDDIYVPPISVREFRDKEFIDLERQIGAEETRHAERRGDVSDEEHHPAEPCRVERDIPEYPQEQIEDIPVHDRDREREQISQAEAADDEAQNQKDQSLEQILGHADAEPAP